MQALIVLFRHRSSIPSTGEKSTPLACAEVLAGSHAVPADHFVYSTRNTFFKLKERLHNNAFQEAAVFDYKGISNPVSLSCCLYISSVKSLYSIEKKKQ